MDLSARRTFDVGDVGPGARLRIAWVCDMWDGVKTGGVLSARRFVEALRAHHDVTVVTAGDPGRGGPGEIRLPGFYVPAAARLMREMGFVFAVPRRRVLEAALREADVVHVQFPFWLGMRSVEIARSLGRPVVCGFHVQPENMLYSIGLRSTRLSEAAYRFFLDHFYSRADAVICPSPFAEEALRQRGLQVPTEVISNGIPPAFRAREVERPARYRGRFLLLAIGRLAREKRLDLVIEGVRRSRHAAEIQLVMTGRGPEQERVRRLGATLPCPAEVIFVSDEELRGLLCSADLMVHASEVELEGMAVLEALGCGLPALVADAPNSATRQFAIAPEFLCEPGDPDAIARRLDLLLERPALLRAARARCRELAARYRFEVSVRRHEALYRRLSRWAAHRREMGGARAVID